MRIFVTGATGFIGTPLVQELIAAGHQVRGMARSDAGARQLAAVGAEVLRGDIKDIDSLRRGATGMDAVVHLAFNHDDWSKFMESAADEQRAIETLADALEPGKRLVITSGVGMVQGQPGHILTESDPYRSGSTFPRQPERPARAAADKGLSVGIVRLPQVHDTRKQGLVTYLLAVARDKGVSAYVGEGSNRWAAAPVAPVAHLYRLAVEQNTPGVTVYNAVGEEGVALRDIAEALGKGLGLPVVSLAPDKADEHFGMFARFLSHDMPASSEQTQKELGWDPSGPTLLEDLSNMQY